MPVNAELMRELHRRMIVIRIFEEHAGRMMADGTLPGFLHLYVGQEAVATGVMAALRIDDQITSTHRGHGHVIAKGGDVRKMFAELYGRSTGYCHGKGGSMHISELELGVLGANGIVGGGIPIAVGAAFANKFKGTDQVAVSFFGDGTTNIGAFHEAMNLAAVLEVPILFVCENNGYGEYSARCNQQKIAEVVDRAAAYGIPGYQVDGMDVVAVYEQTTELVKGIRAGSGPVFLEAKTYRYYDHQGIKGLRIPYRSQDEVDEWKSRDAIRSLEDKLVKKKATSRAECEDVWVQVEAEMVAAIQQASDDPHPQPDDLLTDVYSISEGARS